MAGSRSLSNSVSDLDLGSGPLNTESGLLASLLTLLSKQLGLLVRKKLLLRGGKEREEKGMSL